jgi:hypothetical protein
MLPQSEAEQRWTSIGNASNTTTLTKTEGCSH